MEINIKHPSNFFGLSYRKGSTDYESHISLTSSNSNCKLAYADSIGQIFNESEEDRKSIMTKLLGTITGRNLLVTVLNKTQADWFKTNYSCYYLNIVPCGYGHSSDTNQYHILIKNGSYKDPVPEVMLEKKVLPIPEILGLIEKVFGETQSRDRRLLLIEDGLSSMKLS